MSETKSKRFHCYKVEPAYVRDDRFAEALEHQSFLWWRKRIDSGPAGSIAFAPEAK